MTIVLLTQQRIFAFLYAILIAGLCAVPQFGCQPIKPKNVQLDKDLPVTLRDMDDEYAAAKAANLSFYSQRFFKNAEKSYQYIAKLRKNQQHNDELYNHLSIFKHNLQRAYETKDLVQQRMGRLLVQFLTLENQPVYQHFPEKFQELERLMRQCLKMLELRQIDPQSWDRNESQKFDKLREQFRQGVEKIQSQSRLLP